MGFGHLYAKSAFEFVNEFDLWSSKYSLDPPTVKVKVVIVF